MLGFRSRRTRGRGPERLEVQTPSARSSPARGARGAALTALGAALSCAGTFAAAETLQSIRDGSAADSGVIAGAVASSEAGRDQPQPTPRLSDAAIDPLRRELIEIAFQSATRIPLDPHVKDRAKTQEAVVIAALRADQPLLAARFANPIPGWRRGNAYAALAFDAIERGFPAEARQYLAIAAEVAEREPEEWRRDRIRAGMARTYVLLGEEETARRFAIDLETAEIGKTEAALARVADEARFERLLEWCEQAAATRSVDMTRNAMEVLSGLVDRFHDDPERRRMAEEMIRRSWNPLPILMRVEVLEGLAEIAKRRGDRMKLVALTEELNAFSRDYEWLPEDRILIRSRVAAFRSAAGERERAASELEALLAAFDAERHLIGMVFRAAVVRAIAEAMTVTDDMARAAEIYHRAIDVAVENVNLRPRAEDLAAIAGSIAVHVPRPDATLVERLRSEHDRLVPPAVAASGAAAPSP
ncbi:MAG TPA: hypothetical protein PKC43_11935 [Phycisphaerales bacterium]|nr:hypothetical protein [Phycisphaerales bacterium]HMP38141.1 hypothetical protein [Phycisphaerales bacterium]